MIISVSYRFSQEWREKPDLLDVIEKPDIERIVFSQNSGRIR